MKQSIYVIVGFLAVIGMLGLFFIADEPTPPIAKNETNETIIIDDYSDKVQFGDLVKITYVLRLEDGSVADTNDAALAQEAGLTTYAKGPTTFLLGQSGKVPGFDEALVGMRQGEKREAIIEPTEPEIYRQINLTEKEWRFQSINRAQLFPRAKFEVLFGKPPIDGDIVYNEQFAWKFQVINSTADKVLAKMYVTEGEIVQLPERQWESKVFQVYPDVVSFFHLPSGNATIETMFGKAFVNASTQWLYINHEPELNKTLEHIGPLGIKQKFQVVEIRDDSFVFKRIGILADKRLSLEVELLELTKDVKGLKTPLPKEVQEDSEN